MKKTLSLEAVNVSFDPHTATIELSSDDSRLEGSVKLQLSNQTETYESLFKLLAVEGLADINEVSIPSKSTRITDLAQFEAPGKDTRAHMLIGEGLGNSSVDVDLSSHLLVTGLTGSGKTLIVQDILIHTLNQSDTQAWVAHFNRIEHANFHFRQKDRQSTGSRDILMMLNEAIEEMHNRYSLLEKMDLNDYRELPVDKALPTIRIFMDDFDYLLNSSRNNVDKARNVLIADGVEAIARLGRAAGIQLIASVTDYSRIPAMLIANIHSKIVMGSPSKRQHHTYAKGIFGKAAKYNESMLTNRGRGILAHHGEQSLFQGYFVPWELRNQFNPENS